MENSIGPGPVDSVAVQPHYDEISSKDQENILDHGSVQGVPLKLAVQPNGNPTVSYDMNRWLANGSVKALPISNGNPAAQAQAIHAEPTMNESGSYIPMDSMLADKTFSLVADVRVEAPISPSSTNSDHEAEAPILPPAQNQNQDPMATASVSDQDPVAMESVSDQDPVATASVPDQDPVAIAGETPLLMKSYYQPHGSSGALRIQATSSFAPGCTMDSPLALLSRSALMPCTWCVTPQVTFHHPVTYTHPPAHTHAHTLTSCRQEQGLPPLALVSLILASHSWATCVHRPT